MRYAPIDSQLFITNRRNLEQLLLPNSLAVVNANDILPTSADGTLQLHPGSDLFYLTGVEQEESILLLYPDAGLPALRHQPGQSFVMPLGRNQYMIEAPPPRL